MQCLARLRLTDVLFSGRLLGMYAGPLRLLRALIVSATCVALSLATHLIGAGAGVHHVSVVAVWVC